MNFEQYTHKLQTLIRQAQSLALGRDNTSIGSAHLLSVACGDQANLAIFEQAGADKAQLLTLAKEFLDRQAVTPTPTGQISFASDAVQLINLTESFAQKAHDEFVASEWLLLALSKQTDSKTVLAKAGLDSNKLTTIIQKIRGDSTVNSQNAEDVRGALDKYTVNLTDRAKEGKLDPVIGRDDEIRRTVQVLSRRTKNNPVLIGEPGVVKPPS